MIYFSFIILTLFVTLTFSHGHVRVARQGGLPPPGGISGASTAPNYNYADSTKLADSDPVITSWIRATGRSTTYNAVNNINKIQYSAKYAYVSCSGIPSYSIGPWPNNPNTPSDQSYTFQLPRVPVENTGNKTSVSLGNIGLWSNGVLMFNADDGQTIMNWKRNAYYFEKSSFDSCNGHPQVSGVYHHHVVPVCMFNYNDSSKHSPIVGYAFDGIPVYGPFGYSNATNPTSAIKRMQSSYRLRSMTSRTTLANGTSLAGPNITTYPLGAFLDDYEHISASGDLDQYSGRYAVTPEYPNGIYAYFLSTDSSGNPAYPYTLGYYYYGYVVLADMMSGKVSPTETVTVYYAYSNSLILKPINFYNILFILITLKTLNCVF